MRARLAVMSVYVGHWRATIVTKQSVPIPSGPGGCCALAAAAGAPNATTASSAVVKARSRLIVRIKASGSGARLTRGG